MYKKLAYIETEYSCAYCGIKGKEHLTVDHIDGRAEMHSKKYDNLIVLCHNCHHRKTCEKGITLEDIKDLKKMLIVKTFTQFGVNALKDAYRNDIGVAVNPLFIRHMVALGLFKEIDVITSLGEEGNEVAIEVLFQITDEGRRVYAKWFIN